MENLPSLNPIESQANFEGNASELLFSRLRSEKIKNQLIEMLFQGEQSKIGTFIESLEVDAKGDVVYDESGKPMIKDRVPFVPMSREELITDYEKALSEYESVTEIGFAKYSHDLPTQERVMVGSVAPWSGKPFTARQMSIIEAHEKGHLMRPYYGKYFDELFGKAFDFDAVSFGQIEAGIYKKALPPEDQDKPLDEIKRTFFEYLSSPVELAERMSQLKNYFGMRGDEPFTAEHLEYARRHYVADTDMDNGMTQFFQAITPEKVETFIHIINLAGI